MPNLKANQLLALLTLSTGLATSIISRAEDQLRLPYDSPEDFIRPNDGSLDSQSNIDTPNNTAPAKAARRDQGEKPADKASITNQPQATGNECRGLKEGEFAHAYSLFTRMYVEKGIVYIVYPVFRLGKDPSDQATENRVMASRENSAPQDRYQNSRNEQGQYQQEQDLYSEFRGYGQRAQQNMTGLADESTRRRHEILRRQLGYDQSQSMQRPGMQPIVQNQLVLVEVTQNVFYPDQPARDQWGRFLYDAYGRLLIQPGFTRPEVVQVWMTQEQAMAHSAIRQENRSHQQNRRDQAPAQNQQTTHMPAPRDPAEVAEAECVALPYLRAIKLEGAQTLEDAKMFIEDNASAILRQADTGRKKEPTPRSLGPIASSDPATK